MRDVLSTLIDLSHRGYIVIEEERTEGLFGLGGRTIFTFKRTDKALDDLRKFERNFIDRLFGGQMERTLDSLKNKFYIHIPKLKSDLYGEMVRHKLFPSSPEKTRNYWSGIGVGLLVIAGIAVYGAFTLEDFSFPLLMCIPVALGITGLMMMISGQYMPAKTAKGAEEAAKWKAFREYLTNLEKYRSLEEASAHFDAFLPYAVAFGMERAWIRKFKDLDSMPIPTWYYPTYRGGYWGRGYRAGTPVPGGYGSADDMLPGDLARAGGGGLNDLSNSLSGGLESISNGLTNLLNSAGSTMTSKPQSSGGGGWSGGGSSGGGGSGGGSSGFG
jgi:uncharacterized membrane protein